MGFTVLYDSASRIPTHEEVRKLAETYGVRLVCNDNKGTFSKSGDPRVEGEYEFTNTGLIGKFSAHIALGSIIGSFQFSPRQASVEIIHKPFFVPEALLKSKIAEGLAGFFKKLAEPTCPAA